MIIKDLQPLTNSIVKIKLKNEQEPLIGFIGPVGRYNYNPKIHEDIYPCGTFNVISDWQNFTFAIPPINEIQILAFDIETLEILKNNIPME